jgi:hypothetical protein
LRELNMDWWCKSFQALSHTFFSLFTAIISMAKKCRLKGSGNYASKSTTNLGPWARVLFITTILTIRRDWAPHMQKLNRTTLKIYLITTHQNIDWWFFELRLSNAVPAKNR